MSETSIPGSPGLDEFVSYKLNVLSNMLNRQMDRWLQKQFSISIADWRILAILGASGELSAGDLAKAARMDKALVSRVANRLVSNGYLRRLSPENDRRMVVLSLSDTGQTLYDDIMPYARGRQRKLMGLMNRDDQAKLMQCLDTLKNYMDEIETGYQ